jgi:hypothetical protein
LGPFLFKGEPLERSFDASEAILSGLEARMAVLSGVYWFQVWRPGMDEGFEDAAATFPRRALCQ